MSGTVYNATLCRLSFGLLFVNFFVGRVLFSLSLFTLSDLLLIDCIPFSFLVIIDGLVSLETL